jgi:hypothetical protein
VVLEDMDLQSLRHKAFLLAAWTLGSLPLDGLETLSIGKRKGAAGPVFGIIIKEQTEWQLVYPVASAEAEDCERHVQARWKKQKQKPKQEQEHKQGRKQ